MCPPTYYAIPAVENPRMNVDDQPDSHRAWLQWVSLFNLLTLLGVKINLIEPARDVWELVFTANGAWGRGGKFILSNFRYPSRRPEKTHYKRWLQWLGFEVIEIPEQIFFEGQGDVITLQECYLFGQGFRSSPEAKKYLEGLLPLRKKVITLNLVDPYFYHLDTCFCHILPKNASLYYPGAFDQKSLELIRKLPGQKLEISESLAKKLVLNSIYTQDQQDTVVLLNVPLGRVESKNFLDSAQGLPLNTKEPRYQELLELDPEYETVLNFLWELGCKIVPIYTSEFEKSNAGGRCLILFLD
jgi:N-dimethylarginine dimethylaminohydrolase